MNYLILKWQVRRLNNKRRTCCISCKIWSNNNHFMAPNRVAANCVFRLSRKRQGRILFRCGSFPQKSRFVAIFGNPNRDSAYGWRALRRNFKPYHLYTAKPASTKVPAGFAGRGDGICAFGGAPRQTVHCTVWFAFQT